ncbi:MAG TPA: PepSY-associated TM helix domain-containing protein [Labilithrix sp.]|nr:PepSY-associated TM helix domain-containing protein [Labilithrix sp.]
MAEADPAAATTTTKKKKPQRWRPWLRAMHRDIGYVMVGLTFIYALSGLAVNHLTDWSDGDASFKTYSVTHEMGPLSGEDQAIADGLRSRLAIKETPREVYRQSPEELDVIFDKRSLHVNTQTGRVVDEGQKPRFILRVANWLHLNRGKKAWTYVADGYASSLMILALSGMFMIAGKKGLLGRGAILVGLGIAIPVLYVTFAGP